MARAVQAQTQPHVMSAHATKRKQTESTEANPVRPGTMNHARDRAWDT